MAKRSVRERAPAGVGGREEHPGGVSNMRYVQIGPSKNKIYS